MSLEDREYLTSSVGCDALLTPDDSFGVLGLSVALPLLCYLATFLCNDVAGCPIPSVLHPTVTTWKQLKQEAGWPADGLAGLASFRATAWTLGYYGLSLLMQLVLPGEEFQGVELRSGGRLTYKFNGQSEGHNYGLAQAEADI